MHEWAHYRYGVFDEYGTAGDPEHPLFYRPQYTRDIVPNLCTNEQPIYTLWDATRNSTDCLIDPKTRIYDKNCQYNLDPDFKPKSSIISASYLDSVISIEKARMKNFLDISFEGCSLLSRRS